MRLGGQRRTSRRPWLVLALAACGACAQMIGVETLSFEPAGSDAGTDADSMLDARDVATEADSSGEPLVDLGGPITGFTANKDGVYWIDQAHKIFHADRKGRGATELYTRPGAKALSASRTYVFWLEAGDAGEAVVAKTSGDAGAGIDLYPLGTSLAAVHGEIGAFDPNGNPGVCAIEGGKVLCRVPLDTPPRVVLDGESGLPSAGYRHITTSAPTVWGLEETSLGLGLRALTDAPPDLVLSPYQRGPLTSEPSNGFVIVAGSLIVVAYDAVIRIEPLAGGSPTTIVPTQQVQKIAVAERELYWVAGNKVFSQQLP